MSKFVDFSVLDFSLSWLEENVIIIEEKQEAKKEE
jgi:hypothetical protein